MKSFKILLASFAILGIFAIPTIAFAAPNFLPLVPCGTGDSLCTPCDLFRVAKNLIDLILYGVTGPVAAFMIVFAGGIMVLSGGNVTRFNQGKELLKRTVIGISIIFLAWGATNFIIKSIGKGTTTDSWFKFSCPKALQDISPISTTPLPASPSGGPEAVVTPALPDLLGRVSCPDASLILCPKTLTDLPAGTKCSDCSSNAVLTAAINAYGGSGVATAKVLKSIAAGESSCGGALVGDSGKAGGPFHMNPSTAGLFLKQCNLYDYAVDPNTGEKTIKKDPKTGEPLYINPHVGWLSSPENFKDAACLAGAYLNSLTGACGNDLRNIIAGYNGGTDACKPSRDCPTMPSCTGVGFVRAWECPYGNRDYSVCDGGSSGIGGYKPTRMYAPKVAYCATQLK